MRRSGIIVRSKITGELGTSYNDEVPINGKHLVYFDSGKKKLCNLDNLTLVGYID